MSDEERTIGGLTAVDWWDLSEGMSGMVPISRELRSRFIEVAEKNARDLVARVPPKDVDDAIRADCELLAAWEGRIHVDDLVRANIMAFVLYRRGVADWPDWVQEWIGGGE